MCAHIYTDFLRALLQSNKNRAQKRNDVDRRLLHVADILGSFKGDFKDYTADIWYAYLGALLQKILTRHAHS